MAIQTGYCTNVHAGADLEQTRANLQRYATAVKRQVSPDRPMGVGLWLSASAARALRNGPALAEFAAWLGDAGLVPFTLNGFPYGDFHQQVVKHQVYHPTWLDPARVAYTCDLIAILDGLLPVGMPGSISTLPIAWGQPILWPEQLRAGAAHLGGLAEELAGLEQQSGRRITLCLEPEPGCVLQRSTDVVRFIEDYLLPGRDEAIIRRYLCVCHDVCHAAVMFEEQAEVLGRYRAAGIGVGKVQVSAAVCLPLAGKPPEERQAALEQLGGFNEDRYLHQTMVRLRPQSEPLFFEDLPAALIDPRCRDSAGEWRVHFHVPIYLPRFGQLEASQPAIAECLQALAPDGVEHFEVETYAWGVLPPALREPDLATGIAREMEWLEKALAPHEAASGTA
jgi:sugar phosphate isomerase/epimerase